MNAFIIFLLGVIVGGAAVSLFLRNKKCDASGIASHVQKQQNEKQSRKEKILQIIREKGNVTNNDIETALGVADASATNYLSDLEREGKIEQIGERGRFVSYKLKKL